MITKFIDVTGKTEDEAVANALAQLGLDRDDVSVEILERAKKGFLGIGASPAKVRVPYEAAEEPKPAPAPVRPAEVRKPVPPRAPERSTEKPAPVEKAVPAAAVQEERKLERSEKKLPKPRSGRKPAPQQQPVVEEAAPVAAPVDLGEPCDDEKARQIITFLEGLLEHMGSTARAKVYLEWYSKKDLNLGERVKEIGASCISGRDMVIPEDDSRYFGLYHMEDGRPRNLAMPLCHWGKLYEQLIRTIMDGTWKYDDSSSATKAINYWWGMSAGVIDVVCSRYLPIGTKRLIELLKSTISSEVFNPFSGILYSQTGVMQDDPGASMLPEEIMTMDWLAENVIGSIPKKEELKEQAEPVIKQQGITSGS